MMIKITNATPANLRWLNSSQPPIKYFENEGKICGYVMVKDKSGCADEPPLMESAVKKIGPVKELEEFENESRPKSYQRRLKLKSTTSPE